MKTFYYFILLFTTNLSLSVFSQDTLKYRSIADSVFLKTGEIYFSFTINSKEELRRLTKIISIDHYSGDFEKKKEVHAYANKKQFYNFLKLNYNYTVLPAPGSLIDPVMLKESDLKQFHKKRSFFSFSTYPTYPAYEKLMYEFESKYPDLCKVVNIKTLASGKKLLLLKITDNIGSKEDEPQFLYTSSMHGDETTGYPLMLSLIDYLLSNYGKNERVTNIVNNIEIWINPLANPDGAYKGGNTTVKGATRSNANNIDLNRNYPDPKGGQHPDGEAWQPETKAFMAFADTMNFVMAANFHGGAEVVNYPWDTWSKAIADKNWWIQQCVMYADSAQSLNGAYMDDLYSGNNPGVTQGYPWYEVEGGRQDYMNYFKHCREVTIELSSVKILSESELDKHWKYNLISLLNYMEACLDGIRGIITDGCSGKPLRAKVTIIGHDFDSSHVYSALPVGNYHRPIYAGTYDVQFSASGYQTKTINGVTVSKGDINIQHVLLKPNAPTKPTITQKNTVLYSSAASGNQWFLDGLAITGATDNKYYPLKTGAYTVVTGTCGTSDPFSVIANSLNELNQPTIIIFPNPSDGRFVVYGNGRNLYQMKLQVFDVLGKMVWEKEGGVNDINVTVDLDPMQQGIYYLKMVSAEGTYASKLFLQK